MSLKVDIHKKYKGFSLNIKFDSNGETLGILGASGSGKSLALKCIAGIISPDEGHIELNGKTLFDSASGIDLKPQQRKAGYLFQNYALFPNMTVRQNISCAIGGNKKDTLTRADSLLERFELGGLGLRYPAQLSGGQQQRAALARIIASRPQALLLDEPFSALDSHMREKLQADLLDFLKEEYFGDAVMVTHNRDEAYRLTKSLLVLDGGRVLAKGGTKELFSDPRNYIAARLTGCKNISCAKKVDESCVYAEQWGITFKVPSVPLDLSHIGIRAHDFKISTSANDVNRIRFDLINCMENPFDWSAMFKNADYEKSEQMWWIYAKEPGTEKMPEYLSVRPQNILLLSGKTEN